MLSRVAESVYWMSRYLERAENLARFIDVHWYLTLDLPDYSGQDWEPLINTTGDQEEFYSKYDAATQENVIEFLTYDTSYAGSILSSVMGARENARGIREIISPELWEEVNAMYHLLRARAQQPDRCTDRINDFYKRIKLYGLSFGGIVNDTMMHTESWHFFRMARLLERADKTSRMLDVKYFILLPRIEDVGTPYDNIQWAALLRSTSAQETYRQACGQIVPKKVVEFLVLNHNFPRAIRHCVRRVDESIRSVTQTSPGYYINTAGQQVGQFLADLSYTSIDQIMDIGLHQYIDQVQIRLNQIHDAVHTSFFNPQADHGAPA